MSKEAQDTVYEPAYGFIDTNKSGNKRVKVILTEAKLNRLLEQMKDGHVGLTASFKTVGNITLTTDDYISSFDDAENNHKVPMSSMNKQIQKVIAYKAGNFAELLEGDHA
tara:strand:- start:626 stop:955 length:330 start_codon:yes stop_codon:yes gene_type:complete